MFFLLIYQVYPALQTIYLSFLDRRSETFVGLTNYKYVFTSPVMQTAFKNNLLWLIFFTGTVGLGCCSPSWLIGSVMSFAKSIIFMPMAISLWEPGGLKFMYTYKPRGSEQIGLLIKS